MNGTQPIRPSLWHCLIGATNSLTHVVVPGQIDLPLQRGEKYTVFFERESVVNGKTYSTTGTLKGEL
jgi:hypothetical protein